MPSVCHWLFHVVGALFRDVCKQHEIVALRDGRLRQVRVHHDPYPVDVQGLLFMSRCIFRMHCVFPHCLVLSALPPKAGSIGRPPAQLQHLLPVLFLKAWCGHIPSLRAC